MENIITQDQADEMIQNSEFGDMVEEYELNEVGHVYSLEDGSTVSINFDGIMIHTS